MHSSSRRRPFRKGGWRYSRVDAGHPLATFASKYTHPPEHEDRNSGKEHAQGTEEDTSWKRHGKGQNRGTNPTLSRVKLWWSEILTAVVAIGLLGCIYRVLIAYDGQRISTWTAPVTLTAIVSTISTANRTAIAKIASSVISQAKWSWFWSPATKPRVTGPPIKDMALFDEASRGPTGASLLLKNSVQKPSLFFPLVVIIFAAAMGPFYQQAVQPVTCEFQDEDGTAAVPVLRSLYSTPSLKETRYWGQHGTRTLSLPVRAGIISSFTNPNSSDSAIKFTCTSGNCTFPFLKDDDGSLVTHRSLGLCSSCIDISSYVTKNITNYPTDGPLKQNLSTEWRLPSGQKVYQQAVLRHTGDGYLSEWPTAFLDVNTDDFDSKWSNSNANDVVEYLDVSRWGFLNMTILSINNYTANMEPSAFNSSSLNYTTVSALVCTLYPCLKSYSATIEGKTLNEKLVSTSKMKPYGDLMYEKTDNFGVRNQQYFVFPSDMISVATPCLVDGQTYTAENLSSASDAITLPRRDFGTMTGPVSGMYNGSNAPAEVNITAPRECLYAMEHYDWFEEAQNFFKDMMNGACGLEEVFSASGPTCGKSFWLETLANIPFRTRDEVGGYLDDVAESLTRRFRMGANADGKGEGDATDVPGVVMQTTVCFHVRWYWLIFPAGLTALAVVALVLQLVHTAFGSGDSEMVWKSSILPFLYHHERFVEVDGQGLAVEDEKRGDWVPLLTLKEMECESKRTRVVFQE